MSVSSTHPIILLAAGQSRRMGGRDKLMEDVDGMPLIRRQAIMARASTSGDVIVALPSPPHPRYGALADLDVLCLPVEAAEEGMNASLRTAFGALPPCCDAAMLLLADLPDLTEDDLKSVFQVIDLKSDTLVWRGATANGKPGHPIVFRRDLFAAFANLQGDTGGREVVALAGDDVQLVPLPDDRARADLDTPEAWSAWRARRAEP